MPGAPKKSPAEAGLGVGSCLKLGAHLHNGRSAALFRRDAQRKPHFKPGAALPAPRSAAYSNSGTTVR
jgi:hypothetical protein